MNSHNPIYGHQNHKRTVINRTEYIILNSFVLDFLQIESSKDYVDYQNVVNRMMIFEKIREIIKESRVNGEKITICEPLKIELIIDKNETLNIFFNNLKSVILRRGLDKTKNKKCYDIIQSGKINCITQIQILSEYCEISIQEYLTIFAISIFKKLNVYNEQTLACLSDLYEYM
jgi:hypothetical protein